MSRGYEITVIIDTKEKKCEHIVAYLEKHNVNYIFRHLDFGDYSLILHIGGEDYDLSNKFTIERKATLPELIQNLCTKDNRPRFEAEFQRAQSIGARLELLIEDEGWYRKIITGDYGNGYHKSKASKKQIRSSISYIQQRYGFAICGISKDYAGYYIMDRLAWFARSYIIENRLRGLN